MDLSRDPPGAETQLERRRKLRSLQWPAECNRRRSVEVLHGSQSATGSRAPGENSTRRSKPTDTAGIRPNCPTTSLAVDDSGTTRAAKGKNRRSKTQCSKPPKGRPFRATEPRCGRPTVLLNQRMIRPAYLFSTWSIALRGPRHIFKYDQSR